MNELVSRSVPVVVAAILLALFPLFGGKFAVDLVVRIMILAVFALSLELLVGQTGLVCFGHAAFLGIAAYAAALLSPQSGPAPLLLLLPAAVVAAGLYALVVGALSLRTRGIYFIMVTLAFAQMAYYVFHDTKLGGGSDGIYLYFRPALSIAGWQPFDLDSGHTFYYFVLASLVFTFTLLAFLARSRFGRALAGIRVNEQRMRAVGFPTYGYKLTAFVLAAMLAGLAGFLYALKDGFVNPELLSWHQSGAVLIMIILGGIGSLRGAVIGAFAFALLQELFQSEAVFGGFAQHWQLTLGFAIIACVALMPNGIVGIGRQLGRRVSHLRRLRHA
ncbi:MAG: branched-chain amino acid ABC transporter permease [Burkholderiaceae bacterium]|nr:branched-chain amino acid ABC transporter permease [Burkholderiaceae bacterium]